MAKIKKTKTKTLRKMGKKPIKFKVGGEHTTTGVPADKAIPASIHAEAKAGKLGALAKKQEIFRENVLTGPKGKKGKKKKVK